MHTNCWAKLGVHMKYRNCGYWAFWTLRHKELGRVDLTEKFFGKWKGVENISKEYKEFDVEHVTEK